MLHVQLNSICFVTLGDPSFNALFVSVTPTATSKCCSKSPLSSVRRCQLHLLTDFSMDFRIQEFIAFRRLKSAHVVGKHTCTTLCAYHRDQTVGRTDGLTAHCMSSRDFRYCQLQHTIINEPTSYCGAFSCVFSVSSSG
jgi:hypothetical protein